MRHAHDLRTSPDPHATLRALAAELGDLLLEVVEREGRTVAFTYILGIVDLEPAESEQLLAEALPQPLKETW